jgi:hypothetical protein
MRQDEVPVPYPRVLIGVDHIAVPAQAPGIARLSLAVLPQLATRVHRLAELADDLLRALGGEAWIAPFGPALPTRLGRPRPIEAAEAVMASHQIIPEPCGLVTACREGGPIDCGVWMPHKVYRAIAHLRSIADRHSSVKYRSAWRTTPPTAFRYRLSARLFGGAPAANRLRARCSMVGRAAWESQRHDGRGKQEREMR